DSVDSYLNTHAYPYDDVASLIIAMEGDNGTISLGEDRDSDVFLDQRTFKAKLYYIPMSTVRSTNMAFFTYGSTGWNEAETAEIGQALANRYDVGAIAESLQTTYPGVDSDTLVATIGSTTFAMQEGRQAIIKHDGIIAVPITSNDEAVMEVVEQPDAPDIYSYTINISGIGIEGEWLAVNEYQGYQLHRYEMRKQIASVWYSPALVLQKIWGFIPVTKQNLLIDFFTSPFSAGTGGGSAARGNTPAFPNANDLPVDEFDLDNFEEAFNTSGEMYETPDAPATNTPTGGEVYHEESVASELEEFEVIADEDLVVTEGADDALPETPEGAPRKKSINADAIDNLDVDQIDIVEDVAADNVERFDTRHVDSVDDIERYDLDVDEIDFDVPDGLRQADEVAESASWLLKIKKAYQLIKKPLEVLFAVLDILGLAAEIGFLWLEYVNFYSLYQYERNEELAYAISLTIVLTVVTALSYAFAPFGMFVFLIEAIFMIIDAIAWAYGDKIDSRQIWLRGFFNSIYDARSLTVVKTLKWRGVRFAEMGSLTAGNRLVIEDGFTGVIQPASDDDLSHLDQSSSYGFFRVESHSESLSIAESRTIQDCTEDPTGYRDTAARVIYADSQVCENRLQATVNFDAPVINGMVSMQPAASFDTRYEVCIFNLTGDDCKDKRTSTV
ncbi:MAG: hypothetical protein KC413_19155, partial [Anaerolineales bacterium]|nr:hypothetical protein [Anaerolineales bacterium]